ncbi:MAG: tetratricopeptide repeat protein [Acidobacteria bacterium]|nr:tetratricopeptide repeat protein [Acidobacteriota bacterium]
MNSSKRIKEFTTIIAICFFISSCASPEKEKLQLLKRGKEYLKEQRYAEARIEFRSALKLDKKMTEAHLGLAEAALALGYLQEAAESYYEAMNLDSNNLEARVHAGNLLTNYANEDSLKEAERLANEVLKRDSQYIDGHLLLGNLRIARKQFDEAKQSFDRALELGPGLIDTHLSLANYYEQRAKVEVSRAENYRAEAEATYRRIIEKYPKSSTARLAFGDFLFANKREPEAEQQLLEAHNINQKDKLVLVALRRFYETRQRFDEAEMYLAKLVKLDPDKIAGRAQIIDLHARTGRLHQAISEYRQLLRSNPRYLRGYSRMAELLIEIGDLTGAANEVEAALRINNQDTDSLLIRGRLYSLNGLHREAISDLDRVLRFEPSLPAALYYAADAHIQNNDSTQARLLVNRLLSFYPNNPMGLLMMVRIQLSQNRLPEAEKISTQVIEVIAQLKSNESALKSARIPADSIPQWETKAFISRAVTRIQLRDYQGAEKDLAQAMQIDPDSPEPHINLATIQLIRGDLAAAQRAAARAAELSPGSISAITTLVNVYLRQGNHPAAHAKLDSLLHSQPIRVQLLEQKARVYAAQGDGSNAESTLRRIIEIDSGYLNAYFALADLYQSSRKQTGEAIRELRSMISRNPNNIQQIAQAHLFIGMLEEGRGNFDEAVINYERMLSYDKRSFAAAIALNNLAWLYADQGKGNLDKATDYARHAIAITPEAGFYDTLGYAYFKKRQYEIAIEQFSKAIDRKPANPNFYLHMARAFRDNGNTAKARQAYERALQVGGPNFVRADQARQELASLRGS